MNTSANWQLGSYRCLMLFSRVTASIWMPGALTSYGSQPHDMRANFLLIEQAHRRLKDVVVENKDFEKLIRQYDRPVSLFYCDPPYHATEGYYQNIGEDGFTEKDHIRLRDALLSIEGKSCDIPPFSD